MFGYNTYYKEKHRSLSSCS